MAGLCESPVRAVQAARRDRARRILVIHRIGLGQVEAIFRDVRVLGDQLLESTGGTVVGLIGVFVETEPPIERGDLTIGPRGFSSEP